MGNEVPRGRNSRIQIMETGQLEKWGRQLQLGREGKSIQKGRREKGINILRIFEKPK